MNRLGLLCLLSLLATQCSSSGPSTDDLLQSTYGVEAAGCSLVPAFGTGVSTASGLVFTSAHTVAGATSIMLHDSDGGTQSVELISIDPDLDLAILAIEEGKPSLGIRQATEGERGWLLSWSPDEGSAAKPIEITKRLVVTIEDIYIDDIVERRAIEFAGNVVRGDSGGAVVGEDGEVVGITYAASRERGVGFAVSGEELKSVVDQITGDVVDPGPCVP